MNYTQKNWNILKNYLTIGILIDKVPPHERVGLFFFMAEDAEILSNLKSW
jgi:hypothetical protein